MTLFARAAVLILCLPVHECAHAYVAYRMGDSTARDQGRMTLNPLAHLSPVGALAILACGIGWAKPVPIDARYFKNPKLGMALSALAGPVANLLCGLAGMILFKILAYSPLYDFRAAQAVGTLLIYIVRVNLSLAVFNLLPIPSLDGGRALYLLTCWLTDPPFADRLCRYVSLACALVLLGAAAAATVRYGAGLFLLTGALGVLLGSGCARLGDPGPRPAAYKR